MPTTQQIDAAVVNDVIVFPWIRKNLASGKLPQDVFRVEANKKWIDDYCRARGGFSTATLDEALDELLRSIAAQTKFQENKQKLGENIVHWFEAVPTRKDSLKYFALSDRNWACARHFLAAIKEPPVLSVANWETFVLNHEYTSKFFDWEISVDDLARLISGAKPPYLEFGKVGGVLRPVSGLLIEKFGRQAVDEAYDKFTRNVSKKAASTNFSSHTMDEWRAAEDRKAKEAAEARRKDPRLQEQAKRESENIAWLYRAGANHAATARCRKVLEDLIVTDEAGQPDWFETLKARQAKASELAGL